MKQQIVAVVVATAPQDVPNVIVVSSPSAQCPPTTVCSTCVVK